MKPNNGKPPREWDYTDWLRFLGAPNARYDNVRDVFSSDAGELQRIEVPPYRFLNVAVVDELRSLVAQSQKKRRFN